MAEGRDTLEILLDTRQARRDAGELDRRLAGLGATAGRTADRIDRELFQDFSRGVTRFEAGVDRMRRSLGGLEATAGRVRTTLGGIGQGFRQFALGGLGGAGVAGATVFALDRIQQFTTDSIQVYREAAGSQIFFETTVKRANLSLEQQSAIVRGLQRDFGLARDEAEGAYAQALRLTTRLGRPQDTERLVRAVLNSGAAAGLGPDRVQDLIRQLGTGQEEVTNLLFGRNPSTIQREYALRQGLKPAKLTDQQKLIAVLEETYRTGARSADAFNDRLDSTVGKLDRLSARARDFQRNFGREFLEAAFAIVPDAIERRVLGPEPARRPQPSLIDRATGGIEAFAAQQQAIAEQVRRFNELQDRKIRRIQAAGARAVEGIGSPGDPLLAVRLKYEEQFAALAAKAGPDRFNDPVYLARRTALGITRDAEIDRVFENVTTDLTRQLDSLQARYVGRTNPIAAVFIEGQTQMEALRRQLSALGPAFAEQASQIEREAQKLTILGVADAVAGARVRESDLGARIRELQGGLVTVTRRGFYGQPITGTGYGVATETASARVRRALQTAAAIERDYQQILGGSDAFTPDEVRRLSRRARLDAALAAVGSISARDLAADPFARSRVAEVLREARDATREDRVAAIEDLKRRRESESAQKVVTDAINLIRRQNPNFDFSTIFTNLGNLPDLINSIKALVEVRINSDEPVETQVIDGEASSLINRN